MIVMEKKKYLSPIACQIRIAKEDILALSENQNPATFEDGAHIGFEDFK